MGSAETTIATSTAPVTISVRDVHIEYELFADRRSALLQRTINKQGTGRAIVHAVKGVSVEFHQGEATAIVGSNGSGKSTLLTAIAGLMPIRSGEIRVSDEPKLFGIGAALLPQTTGYRNIRLGCLALGVPIEDLDDTVQRVADFTALGDDALKRPLRTYSSGMKARLHFAIATSVSPRLLLIDEGMAVGDRQFRVKARERISSLVEGAGTLLLVSHNMNEVRQLCTRAVWLEQGELIDDGPVDEVLDRYDQA